MSLPHQLFAPSFRHQRLGWFFAVIVGILVFVATFAMATEATLSAITFTWDKGMENRMTVEVPAVEDESNTSQEERIRQTMAVLKAIPDITRIKQVSREDTLELLEPWIKQSELLKTLPIPVLIDFERKSGSSLTARDIEERLQSAMPNLRVDDHASWLQDIKRLINGLILIGALMILLTGVTLVIAVSLVCRAIMATERETVSLLHTMGAADSDIALHFQMQTQELSAPPALIGFLLAIVSTGILLFFLRNFADPTSLSSYHWIGLTFLTLMVPVAAIAISAASARMSVLKLLHAMP